MISALSRFTNATFALALAFCGPALAQTAEVCLAHQLQDLDTPPRGDDWFDLHRAATTWHRDNPDIDLPDLTPQTALFWCRALGLFRADLQDHWPSRAPRIIETAGRDDRDIDVLRSTEAEVRRFVTDRFGIRLAGQFVLVAAEDDRSLKSVMDTGLERMDRPALNLGDRYERYCTDNKVGGLAGRNFIALCWPEATAPDPAYSALRSAGVRPVLAHEFAHQAQYELAADIPPRLRNDGTALLGPEWMVEGMAEYVELRFTAAPDVVDGPDFFDLQSPARRSRTALSDMRANGSVISPSDYQVVRFAALLLAQKHGGRALFDYFESLGRLGDQAEAFRATFGQDMEAFETEFESLRRDYEAARTYGKS